MKTIFMPLNLKMESTIIENVQLLEGQKFYPVLHKLIAHVESYKAVVAKWKDTDDLSAVIAKWNDDDLSKAKHKMSVDNNALIEFPINFDECVKLFFESALERKKAIEHSWTGYNLDESNTNLARMDEKCS